MNVQPINPFTRTPSLLLSVVLLALPVVATGCDSAAPPPTDPSEEDPSPIGLEMSMASGAEIVRFTDGNFMFRHHGEPDGKSGLQSFHSSIDIGHLCATGQPLFHGVEIQSVLLPTDDEAILLLGKADQVYTLVTSEVLTDFSTCEAIFANLVAHGLTTWRQTDNDVSGTSGRANAFGHTAHGVLELAGGGLARYSEVKRLTFRPGAAEHTSDVYRINLEPLASSVSGTAAARGRTHGPVTKPFKLDATLVWNVDQSVGALAACPGTPGLAVGGGEGTGSHVGRFQFTKLDHCSVDLAPPVGLEDISRQGEFELRSADGSTLFGTYVFLFLPPEDGGFFNLNVEGGTRRFHGASGALGFVSSPGFVTCDDPLCLVNTMFEVTLGGTLIVPRP